MTREILIRLAAWTKLKFKLHTKDEYKEPVYFYEREIWWCALGANIGHEQDGKNENFERPVLVIRKFSRHLLWVLPLTSKQKQGHYYFQTNYKNQEGGGEVSSIILSQLRVISSRRLLRKVRTLPEDEFADIRERLQNLLIKNDLPLVKAGVSEPEGHL